MTHNRGKTIEVSAAVKPFPSINPRFLPNEWFYITTLTNT